MKFFINSYNSEILIPNYYNILSEYMYILYIYIYVYIIMLKNDLKPKKLEKNLQKKKSPKSLEHCYPEYKNYTKEKKIISQMNGTIYNLHFTFHLLDLLDLLDFFFFCLLTTFHSCSSPLLLLALLLASLLFFRTQAKECLLFPLLCCLL